MKNAAADAKSPKRSGIARLLALSGTIIIFLPVLFAVITSVVGSAASKTFLFDYLMPAELFPLAALGAVLLIVGAYLGRRRLFPLCAASLLMAACLAAGQLTAVYTGLASGQAEAEEGVFAVVIALFAAYSLLLLIDFAMGLSLVKKLFKKS